MPLGKPHTDIEGLVADLQKATEETSVTKDTVAALEGAVKGSEVARLYNLYERGACPTLDSIDAGCRTVAAALHDEIACLKEEGRPESVRNAEALERSAAYLLERRGQILYLVRAYTDSIAQMHRLRANSAYFVEETYHDRLVEIDGKRRRLHDALMGSLRELTTRLDALDREGYVDGVTLQAWHGWTSPPAQKAGAEADNTPVLLLFAPDTLTHARREGIQQWAVVADLHESFAEVCARSLPSDGNHKNTEESPSV